MINTDMTGSISTKTEARGAVNITTHSTFSLDSLAVEDTPGMAVVSEEDQIWRFGYIWP